MLQLKDITKDYAVAGGALHALKGISLNFRKSEFVSILGASGCGKTTLLNIIGGLDKYTSGDLIINGVSTKKFKDGDWDTYRNHSIGFIFQSYHLIPHQTILQNVELALTISGIDKEERRRRAMEALEKVGLKDRINNRPNQLSGGQAQRVAIARALINDPEIVLADEPTGALDSKTSVQIMELLKEISKDRLVIMVTHNPELAEQYSTRIIRLLDGQVTDDSSPYDGVEEEQSAAAGEVKINKGRKKRSSMSFGMAFMLSLKNLLSKIKRTTMVAVAGSIGIIGVSMVLAISSGVHGYIDSMQDDMLSGNPLQISETALDFEALMNFAAETPMDVTRLEDKVYVDSLLDTLMGMGKSLTTNNITENYVDYVSKMDPSYYNALQYGYEFNIANNIYTDFKITDGEISADADTSGYYSITGIRRMYTSILQREKDYANYASMISQAGTFGEIPDNYKYILSQYDVLATSDGKTEKLTESELKDIFESKDSLIMVLENNAVTDITLGQFGYFTQEQFLNYAYKALKDNDMGGDNYDETLIEDFIEGKDFSYFVGEDAKKFTWYPNDTVFSKIEEGDAFYTISSEVYALFQTIEEKYNLLQDKIEANPSDPDIPKLTAEIAELIKEIPQYIDDITDKAAYKYNHERTDKFTDEDAVELKVKAVLQKKSNISYGCLKSGLYYTNALTEHMLETSADSEIVEYIDSRETGSVRYIPYNFEYTYIEDGKFKKSDTIRIPGISPIPNTGLIAPTSQGLMMGMMTMPVSSGSSDGITAAMLGGSRLPVLFNIYPVNFETKDLITDYLDHWNDMCRAGEEYNGQKLSEADIVKYTDTVGLIIMMINTMIQMITIALIAFTALSLVVSTVMVGIITYVSVVERIKEIGILRSVGARKKDIKRLFIAETFIIGLAAGIVGIAVTYILSLIVNLIVGAIAGIFTIASLPVWQALIMVAVSVVLTLISSLIPASAAAKKDPVVALRTE